MARMMLVLVISPPSLEKPRYLAARLLVWKDGSWDSGISLLAFSHFDFLVTLFALGIPICHDLASAISDRKDERMRDDFVTTSTVDFLTTTPALLCQCGFVAPEVALVFGWAFRYFSDGNHMRRRRVTQFELVNFGAPTTVNFDALGVALLGVSLGTFDLGCGGGRNTGNGQKKAQAKKGSDAPSDVVLVGGVDRAEMEKNPVMMLFFFLIGNPTLDNLKDKIPNQKF